MAKDRMHYCQFKIVKSSCHLNLAMFDSSAMWPCHIFMLPTNFVMANQSGKKLRHFIRLQDGSLTVKGHV